MAIVTDQMMAIEKFCRIEKTYYICIVKTNKFYY